MSDQQPPGWGPPQPPQQPGPPPGWGQPQPPQQPPGWGPPPRKRHTGRNIALAVLGIVVALGVIGALVGDDPTTTTAPGAGGGPDTTAAPGQPEETTAPETTAKGGPATAKVGETLQFEDSFGDHAVDVTVARKKVSTGGEFDKPQGVYVGLFVQVKAYQDGISVPGFYVLAGGKRYEQTFTTGFEPGLVAFEVNKGETAEGWLVFEVPSRSGRFVMKEFASDKPQAIWSF